MIADTYTGESARLGYLDINGVLEDVHLSLGVMKQFNPEAIFIYSCICRRFALQQDIEMELSPFNEIAPVSGFYTYGEFCSTATRNEILNSSEVVIGIREGMLESKPKQVEIANQNEIDYYKTRHIQIMSRLLHFISALTDQLDEANQALKFQAEHDQLTEALNRHAFKSNLDLEISHSNQLGHRLSFILFDIDHFKLINDKYGHLAGDHVLKCVVEAVQKSTRGNDTLYRYGGEEFLLLLPETALDGAIFVAEKIRKNIETTTIDYEGNELPSITASFGVACYPDQDEDVERLMSALDQALYQSKSLGRNRTSIAHR